MANGRRRWQAMMAALALGATSTGAAAPPGKVLAAGSLRPPVDEILAVWQQRSGQRYEVVYGPSGKLRQLIEQGEPAAVFLSASIAHTDALKSAGKLESSQPFTRNALCLMAAPGRKVTAETAVDVMLDPTVRLGTSTPKADPSGDYTWEMFRRVDAARPGSFARLDAKALKLTGGAVDRQQTGLPYAAVFRDGKADVFVSYCTNAVATASELPGLTWVRLPDSINVGAVYGLGVAADASPGARALADFIFGPDGQAILERHGFAATSR
jgi:molybdenum ABC transporter molybdate-binding protein